MLCVCVCVCVCVCAATSSLQRARQPTIKCVICIEDVPLSDTACISSDCGHLFCYECVSQYVLTKVKDRKYPIVCPAPGCTATGTHETLLELMQPHDAELKVTHTHKHTHAHTHAPPKVHAHAHARVGDACSTLPPSITGDRGRHRSCGLQKAIRGGVYTAHGTRTMPNVEMR